MRKWWMKVTSKEVSSYLCGQLSSLRWPVLLPDDVITSTSTSCVLFKSGVKYVTRKTYLPGRGTDTFRINMFCNHVVVINFIECRIMIFTTINTLIMIPGQSSDKPCLWHSVGGGPSYPRTPASVPCSTRRVREWHRSWSGRLGSGRCSACIWWGRNSWRRSTHRQ